MQKAGGRGGGGGCGCLPVLPQHRPGEPAALQRGRQTRPQGELPPRGDRQLEAGHRRAPQGWLGFPQLINSLLSEMLKRSAGAAGRNCPEPQANEVTERVGSLTFPFYCFTVI